jgi:hypothetical protein
MAAVRGSADYLLDLLRREGNVPMCRAYQHHTHPTFVGASLTERLLFVAPAQTATRGGSTRYSGATAPLAVQPSTTPPCTLCVCYNCLTLTCCVRACLFVPIPVVALFCRLHELTRESKYLAAARAAADCTWREGLLKKSISLCHGAVGNAYAPLSSSSSPSPSPSSLCVCVCVCWCAVVVVVFVAQHSPAVHFGCSPHSYSQNAWSARYAFLTLHRHTREEEYLLRARVFVLWSLTSPHVARLQPDCPYSLFGTHCLQQILYVVLFYV